MLKKRCLTRGYVKVHKILALHSLMRRGFSFDKIMGEGIHPMRGTARPLAATAAKNL